MNRVTLLIPNYNNGPYLKECLESIKNQSYSDFDILIIDDGSTDNSIEIIKQFQDHRNQLVQKEKNSGIVDTLNVGLDKISTEFFIRMDADDIMDENRIELLVNFMDANPQFGICGSGTQHFGLSDNKIYYQKDPIKNNAHLIFSHSICHASCIFRTEILKTNGIQYQNGYKLLEDYKLFYDLSKVTTMTSIDDMLYHYRQTDYNDVKKYMAVRRPGFEKLYSEILTSLQFSNPKNAASIHFELFKNVSTQYRKADFKAHMKTLIKQNNTHKIFPQQAYTEVVSKIYDELFYKLVDQNKINLFESIEFFMKSPAKGYYFLKKKLKK